MLRFTKLRVLIAVITAIWVLLAFQSVAIAQVASPHLIVNTSRLNVRSGPGVGHSIITSVPGGTVLPVTMVHSGRVWYQVTSTAGTGWVNSNYTVGRGDFSRLPSEVTPTNLGTGAGNIPEGAPHMVVNTSYLNVRTGPGVGHDVLTVVKGATVLPIVGVDGGRVWYQVDTSAGRGWVHRRYTVIRGNLANIAVSGSTAPVTVTAPAVPEGGAHVVVNTSFLNVRTGPGLGHDVLAVVRGGTVLPVVSRMVGNVWYEVDTSAGRGWVNRRYTATRGNFGVVPWHGGPATSPREGGHLSGSTPRAVVNTSYLNVRSGPGVGNAVVATVPGGSILKVLGLAQGRGWYLVEGSFGQGWLNNNYTVFRGDFGQVPTV